MNKQKEQTLGEFSAQQELRFNMERLMEESGCHTQSHLSRLSGVAQPHISVILKGTKSVSLDNLERLARGMGFLPVDLLMPTNWVQAKVPILIRKFLGLAPEKRALVFGLIQDLQASSEGKAS